MITHEPAKLLSGHFETGHLISYKSGTIKRVVRSTLASEAYSISEAAEQAEWIRHVLHELHSGPTISLREVESTACSRPVIVCTDSHNLADTVQSDAGTTSDKRLRIVTAMLRQTFGPDTGMTLRWVNTHEMYADALTKVMVALAVIAIMASKHYSPPAGRIGRVATLAQRASSGIARGIALTTLVSSPTGAHAARLQIDLGEWAIFDQLALGLPGWVGEYLLVALITLVLTLAIWLVCQYRFLYALQSTSRDHWQSLVSLYGQASSQHRPYLEFAATDTETQTEAQPFCASPHRHPRKLHPGRNKIGVDGEVQESGT